MNNRRNTVYSLLILSLLLGLASGRALLFNIAYLLGGLLIFSFVWTRLSVSWVRLQRTTRARRAQVGKTFTERFAIYNTGILPKLWLEVRDHSSLPGHLASQIVPPLLPRSHFRWQVHTMCTVRGEFQLGPITIAAGDPFGLFLSSRHIPARSRIIVLPATVPIYDFATPSGLLPGGDAQRRRAHFVTTNAAGVREYAPGDSFNRIHWRSTARKNRLLVKEFELDPLADVWIFLDLSAHTLVERPNARHYEIESANGEAATFKIPPSTEEYGIVITSSLAKFFLDKGRNLGLVTYAPYREVLQADRSQRQLSQILNILAVADSTGDFDLEHMLNMDTEYLGRGTTLIIVTADQTQRWIEEAHILNRRGIRIVAVIIDPASFGGTEDSRATQARLEAIGISTYVVREGDDLTVVLSRRLHG